MEAAQPQINHPSFSEGEKHHPIQPCTPSAWHAVAAHYSQVIAILEIRQSALPLTCASQGLPHRPAHQWPMELRSQHALAQA